MTMATSNASTKRKELHTQDKPGSRELVTLMVRWTSSREDRKNLTTLSISCYNKGVREEDMATRTYIKTKKGHEEVWEWEETPEVLAALKVYWDTVRENASKASSSIVF